MANLDALASAGDPVDPDLVSLLAAEGVDTLDSARALGRPHFVSVFTDSAGFTRDFVTILEELGLTWESAASAERFQCPVDEMEIGVPASIVAEALGAETFGAVYTHPRETVQLRMAERGGMLAELDALLERHGGW